MTIDKNIARLICDLEYIVGNQTYNPNSYNGWTGEEGCAFKYPVTYCRNKSDYEKRDLTKTKSHINFIEPECIKTMKYAFGSNHLYIGEGLVGVLNYLEDTYGIDFDKLEEERIEARKKTLFDIEKKILDGEEVKISSGIKVVGIDLPVGNYVLKKGGYSFFLYVDIYDENGESIEYIRVEDEETVDLKKGYIVNSMDDYLLKFNKPSR